VILKEFPTIGKLFKRFLKDTDRRVRTSGGGMLTKLLEHGESW
jgi:hypothetical protein